MVTNNSANQSITQYNVQTGAALGTLNNVAPSATSGVPLISQGAASQPAFGTAVVAGGGTGIATTTAYGVICGGTTATGNFQNTGTGTSGYYLKSNGAASLPTWAAATLGTFSVVTQVFTGSGTYTPTSGMVYCVIECVGGGGGGGGCPANAGGQWSFGGGGGGGEFASGVFSAATIGASKSVTIGAAGTTGSNAAGGAGGTTSVGATNISAVGGAGGTVGTSAANAFKVGVLGGTGGTGGDYRFPGAFGAGTAWSVAGGVGQSGAGGGSNLGVGGLPLWGASGTGGAGLGYGGGGAGSGDVGATGAKSGGAATAGVVIVTEYVFA